MRTSSSSTGASTPTARPNPDFVLNFPVYKDATVMVAGRNFGCGSSREHAPWALQQYGFRAIIAPSYADIFYNNCLQNGLLPVRLSEADVDRIMIRSKEVPGYQVKVDLESCTVTDNQGLSASLRPRRVQALLPPERP